MPALTPAQIRAGRALVGLSQEELALSAKISPSTLRALEGLRRPTDGEAARAVQRELEAAGIAFVESDAYGGPGVRLAMHSRPTLVRLPSVVTKWEGVPCDIEWQGRTLTAFVSSEVLADLAGISAVASDEALLQSFAQHREAILDAAARVVVDSSNYDKQGRVYIRTKDVDVPPSLQGGSDSALPSQITVGARVKLDPPPKRIWQGVAQPSQTYTWQIDRYDAAKGLAVISNISTGHFLPLHTAHIAGARPFFGPNADGANFTLALTVQVVFEDGRARLERL